MILGMDYLLSRVKEGQLVRNLSERELSKPEGAGFDLRLGEIHSLNGGGFLGIQSRETSATTLLAKYDPLEKNEFVLEKGNFYLFKTIEEIELDNNMLGFFHPRSTLFRSGVILQSGVQPYGYSGPAVFGIFSTMNYFKIELGARFVHLNILKIDGNSYSYTGQWQGGRITTDGPEIQQ